jgi:hypothetical protein
MTTYWNHHWPKTTDNQHIEPLGSMCRLPQDGRLSDYRNIAWRKLLFNQSGVAPNLDLLRSNHAWRMPVHESEININ